MSKERKKFKRSIDIGEAKVAFSKEGVDGLGEAFKGISADRSASSRSEGNLAA